MKKSLLIIALFLVFGCDKYLEVVPEYKLPAESATSHIDSLQKITVGAFNQLQSGSLYGGGLIANSELLSDNWDASPISDFSLNQLRTRDMNTYNGVANGLWNDGYRAINMANIVLEFLPIHQAQNESKANLLKGECLFIRAVCHFEMLRMFALPANYTSDNSHLGIPIRLNAGSANEEQNNQRATVEEVYQQIIFDLEQSIILLPEDKSSRVSKWAAMAFLTKVYFQKNDFANCINWSDQIINSGQFSLNSTVNEIYNLSGWNFSNETIFQIINIPEDNSNGTLTGRLKSNSVTYSSHFTDAISNQDDLRTTNLYTFLSVPYLKKYSNTAMNVTVVRLAEILLSRAESKFMLDYPHESVLEDINLLRERAGLLSDDTCDDPDELLTSIRQQRNIELGFEGDRFHEVKRHQGTFESELGTFKWDDPKLVYPIPQQEMDQNENMIQNPTY